MFHVGRPNENGFTGKVWHTLGQDCFNSHTNICSSGGRTPTIQWSNDDRSSPDWANAKLIFLNSSHAADAGHYFQQAAGHIADARAKGAKLVVMDPRMSNSAGMADLWIAAWLHGDTADCRRGNVRRRRRSRNLAHRHLRNLRTGSPELRTGYPCGRVKQRDRRM